MIFRAFMALLSIIAYFNGYIEAGIWILLFAILLEMPEEEERY